MTPGAASANLRSLAERAASRLPPLLLAAERVAAAAAPGAHGRRRVGSGDAFWQFRRYQPQDPPSMIDWRQSARADAVYVRENEWEAAQSLHLWRDGSGSMDYRSSQALQTKRERADVLALALAVLLVRAGERVAPLGGGVRPMGGRFALDRLAALLSARDDGGENAFRLDGPPPPRFAGAALIGDFLDADDRVESCMRELSERGVRGCLLQVLDPAEEDLPFEGRVRLTGLEGEESLLVPRIDQLRDAYRRRLADRRDHLAALARAAGWRFVIHRTDQPAHAALLALWAAASARGGEETSG